MLRIGFLPSDFNPMLLMLGEQEDLRALAGALRQFARDGRTMRLDTLGFCAAGGTRVSLRGGTGAAGLHADADNAGAFVWRLDAGQAAAFAELVDGLAVPSRKAGSEMLECGIEDAEEISSKCHAGNIPTNF